MKQYFSKKTRLLIGLGVGLMSATAIVTPLATSCATTKRDLDVTGFDKQYNISKVTYTHLQDSVASEYKAKLQHEGKYTESEIVKKVGEARETIKNFDKRVRALKNGLSFYQMTDSLIDFAKNEFDVDVEREFNEISINWTLENEKFKSSLKDTLRNALRIDEFTSSETEKFLANFETEFTRINTSLSDPKSNDFIKDPLKRFHQLQSSSITCFDNINDELTQLSANAKMKNFNKKYNFVFDQTEKPSNNKVYFEDLRDNYKFKINQDITSFIENNFQVLDNATKKYTKPDLSNLISGFRIVPLFKGLNANVATNQYTMMIDWVYVRADKFEKMHTATGEIDMNVANSIAAHSALPNGDLTHSDDLSNFEKVSDFYKIDDSQKDFSTYQLPVRIETELQGLQTYYLDKITFEWDTQGAPANDKYKFCRYEPFFGVHAGSKVGNATDNFTKLSASDLAEVGLRLSEKASPEIKRKLHSERLDKLLAKANKISKLDKTPVEDKSKTLNADDYSLTIIDEFVKNCDIKSHSTVIDDNKHDVANTLYVSYKDSSFPDSKKWKMIGKEDDFHCTGMPISNEFYGVVNKEFLKVKAWADQLRDASNIDFSTPLKKVVHPAWWASVSIFGILMLLSGIAIFKQIRAKGFKKTFKIPKTDSRAAHLPRVLEVMQKIICFVGSCIGIGLILTLMGESFALLAHYETWKRNKKRLESSPNYQGLMKKIDDDYEQKFKDYNRFKYQPMGVILKDLDFYKNISNEPLYKEFIKDWHSFTLTADDLLEVVMPKWVNIFNKTIQIAAVVQVLHMVVSIVVATIDAIALSVMLKQAGLSVTFGVNMQYSFSRMAGIWKGRASNVWNWKYERALFERRLKNSAHYYIKETGEYKSEYYAELNKFDEHMKLAIKKGLSLKQTRNWSIDDLQKYGTKEQRELVPEDDGEMEFNPDQENLDDIIDGAGDRAEQMPESDDYYEDTNSEQHSDHLRWDTDTKTGERIRRRMSYDSEEGNPLPYETEEEPLVDNQSINSSYKLNQPFRFVQLSDDKGINDDDNDGLILLKILSPVEIAATSSKWMKENKMAYSFDWMLRKAEDFSYDENMISWED